MLKHISKPLQENIKLLSKDRKNIMLVLNWHRFVRAEHFHHCKVSKLIYHKDSGNHSLVIIATAGVATELEYEVANIKTSINDFMGMDYINKVIIKQGLTIDNRKLAKEYQTEENLLPDTSRTEEIEMPDFITFNQEAVAMLENLQSALNSQDLAK